MDLCSRAGACSCGPWARHTGRKEAAREAVSLQVGGNHRRTLERGNFLAPVPDAAKAAAFVAYCHASDVSVANARNQRNCFAGR